MYELIHNKNLCQMIGTLLNHLVFLIFLLFIHDKAIFFNKKINKLYKFSLHIKENKFVKHNLCAKEVVF